MRLLKFQFLIFTFCSSFVFIIPVCLGGNLNVLQHSCNKYRREAASLHHYIIYLQKCINRVEKKNGGLTQKDPIETEQFNDHRNKIFLTFQHQQKDSNYFIERINWYKNEILICKTKVRELNQTLQSCVNEKMYGATHDINKHQRFFYYLQKKINLKELDFLKRMDLQSLLDQTNYQNGLLSSKMLLNPSQTLPSQYQTRKKVNASLPQNSSGLNPQQKQDLQNKLNNVKTIFDKIKDSINHFNPKKDTMYFKPNPYRGLLLKDRIEKHINWQTQKPYSYFPAIINISCALGFKLCAKVTPQIGLIYKIGLGTGFDHIALSRQGFGIRIGVDYNLHRYMKLFANYDRTYSRTILSETIKFSQPISSFVIGAGIRGKLTIQLGYDFLNRFYSQNGSPWIIRFGL